MDLQDELLIPPAASRPKWHFLAPLGVAVLCLCFPQDRGLLSSTPEPGSLPPGCQSAAKEQCGEPPRCFSRSCKGLLANHAINSSAANADSSAVRTACYTVDEELQHHAVNKVAEIGDISWHCGLLGFCIERLSSNALKGAQYQAEKRRCMLFLSDLRQQGDKTKDTFASPQFRSGGFCSSSW